jgi:hypothetical protein
MLHCRSAITEFGDSSDERLKMNAKQASPSTLYGCRILNEILKHLSPPLWWIMMEERTAELCRVYKRGNARKTSVQHISRHNPEVGIMPLMPLSA